MRYLSLFSGIEAASCAWQPLGWALKGVCEIEKFPCNVLKHHYPDVPNLGDITKLTNSDLDKFKDVDLIVGGSPCQSFSVAGKQTGLEGASRLAYDYIRVLDYIRPKYFVWENVPGALSTHKGEDFEFLLNQWESLGYILEANILDAQYFGVAQRRRRIFVWGLNRAAILRKKSNILDLTMGNNLMQILQLLLEEQKDLLNTQEKDLDSPVSLSAGLLRMMQLFLGVGTNVDLLPMLQQNWGMQFLKLVQGLGTWVSVAGITTLGMTVKEDSTLDIDMVNESMSIDILWKKSLTDLLSLMKLCTTSTVTARTMILTICTFAKLVPSIVLLIALTKSCLPSWCRKDTLSLTVLQEFIKYARQANKNIFFKPSTHFDWATIIRVTELTDKFIRNFGAARDFTEVLPESQSLPRYLETLERTREDLARKAEARTGKTGTGTTCLNPWSEQSKRVLDINGKSDCLCASEKMRSITKIFDDRSDANKNGTYNPWDPQGKRVQSIEGKSPCLSASADAGGNTIPLVMDTGTAACMGYGKYVETEKAETLRASGGDLGGGSENICYDMAHPVDVIRTYEDGKTPTLEARMGTGGNNIPLVQDRTLYLERQYFATHEGKASTLTRDIYRDPPAVLKDEKDPLCCDVGWLQTYENKAPTQLARQYKDPPIVLNEAYRIGSYYSNSMQSDNPNSGIYQTDKSATLQTADPTPACQQGGIAVIDRQPRVRKLTPTECLRLQGFPDDWFDGVEGYSDTAAYKAIGNSMAVPCMRWIGERIDTVEKELQKM